MKNPFIISKNTLYGLKCKTKFMKRLLKQHHDKLVKRKAQQTKDHNYIEKVKEKDINLHKKILEELEEES